MLAYPPDQLRRAAEACLTAHGVLPRAAAVIIDHLLTADLRGRPTHGLATRLDGVIQQAGQGVIGHPPELLRDDATTLLYDGHNTNGYLAGHDATRLLAERALAHGHCLAALRRVRHTGMLGYYVEMAAREGLVAMAFTHCCPLMAPTGGAAKLLGTNPLAFAFPAEPAPIVVDLSTAAIGYGQLRVAQLRGEALPEGAAIDADGTPTTDPAAALAGSLLPFNAKGGALAVAVQLLAGAFLGATAIPPPGENYGLLLIACRRDLFAAPEAYDQAVAEFIAAYEATPARPGQTLRLPGQQRILNPPATLDVSPELASLLAPYLSA